MKTYMIGLIKCIGDKECLFENLFISKIKMIIEPSTNYCSILFLGKIQLLSTCKTEKISKRLIKWYEQLYDVM